MFYLTTHSTHFIYGYMASNVWLRTILIVRKKTRCCDISYSFRLTARVLLYAPSWRQDNTYHRLCYTSRGPLAGTRNSSMGPPHEGSIRWPIAPWANALTTELHLAPLYWEVQRVGNYLCITLNCTFFLLFLLYTQTFTNQWRIQISHLGGGGGPWNETECQGNCREFWWAKINI